MAFTGEFGNNFGDGFENRKQAMLQSLNEIFTVAPGLQSTEEEIGHGYVRGMDAELPAGNDFLQLKDDLKQMTRGLQLNPSDRQYRFEMNRFLRDIPALLDGMQMRATNMKERNPKVRSIENQAATQVLRFLDAAKDYLAEMEYESKKTAEISEEVTAFDANMRELQLSEEDAEESLQTAYESGAVFGVDLTREFSETVDEFGNRLPGKSAREVLDLANSKTRELEVEFQNKYPNYNRTISEYDANIRRATKERDDHTRKGPEVHMVSAKEKEDIENKIENVYSYDTKTVATFHYNKEENTYRLQNVDLSRKFMKDTQYLSKENLEKSIGFFTPERKEQLKARVDRLSADRTSLEPFNTFMAVFSKELFEGKMEYSLLHNVNEPLQMSKMMVPALNCTPEMKAQISTQLNQMAKLMAFQKKSASMEGVSDKEKNAGYKAYLSTLKGMSNQLLSSIRDKNGRDLDAIFTKYQEIASADFEYQNFENQKKALEDVYDYKFGKEGIVTKHEEIKKKNLEVFEQKKAELDHQVDEIKGNKAALQKKHEEDQKDFYEMRDESLRFSKGAEGFYTNTFSDIPLAHEKVVSSKEQLNVKLQEIKEMDDTARTQARNTFSNKFNRLMSEMEPISESHFFGHSNTTLYNNMMTELRKLKPLFEKEVRTEEENAIISQAAAYVADYVEQRKPEPGKMKGTDQGQKRYDIATNLNNLFNDYASNHNTLQISSERTNKMKTLTEKISSAPENHATASSLIEKNKAAFSNKAKEYVSTKLKNQEKKHGTLDVKKEEKVTEKKQALSMH